MMLCLMYCNVGLEFFAALLISIVITTYYYCHIKMTIRIVHKDIINVIIDAILFVLYMIFFNMYGLLVILLSEVSFTSGIRWKTVQAM